MTNTLKYLFVAVISFPLLFCSKTDTIPPPPPSPPDNHTPSISSVHPVTGGYMTQIVISGKNFSTDSLKDIVKVNGVNAVIVNARVDTIVAMVPLGAGTGPVTVTINGATTAGNVFTYSSALVVSTFAGNGINDFNHGASSISTINNPYAIAVDEQGNVYVSEFDRIKKIKPDGEISVLAGNGIMGYKDTIGREAEFAYPQGLAVDKQGNVFVADNSVIRKITPDGVVTTFAGSLPNGFADGQGAAAKFFGPTGLAIDADGNLYVSDYGNKRIRKITPDATVTTLAGNGVSDYRDGPGDQAEFFDIQTLAVDHQGNVYVCETWNGRVRKITPDGTVSVFIGSTTSLVGSDSAPLGIAIDAADNIYVGDHGVVVKISSSGEHTIYAGSVYVGDGILGYKDGPALTAQFYGPNGLAVDKQGNVYVSDQPNFRIRKISFQ